MAATLALGAAFAVGPAQAMPMTAASGLSTAAATAAQDARVEAVQWRRYGHRHYYDGGDSGAAIAGGIIGLAAGAMIAGAAAAPPPPPAYYYEGSDPVAYCMQRFRSYDPRSGTYLGYDGYRHPCP